MRIEAQLVVVGAGYAGVNAINSAAHHLNDGDRIVVIARENDFGGQWVGQYAFVRLHQPHERYTAGSRRWMIQRPPEHLATLPEIARHLKETIVDAAVEEHGLHLVTLFEYEWDGAHDVTADGRARVHARALRNGPPANVEIIADKVIVSTGTNTAPLKPLRLSAPAAAVHSLAPRDVLTTEWSLKMRFGDGVHKPIFVVGSGKTALDVIYCLSKAHPDVADRIHCVSGRGTYFINRSVFMADTAWGRNFPLEPTLLDRVTRLLEIYDGTNARDVYRQMASECSMFISPVPDPETHMAGTASVEEVEHVRAVLSPVERRVFKAYLVDVVADESGAGAVLLLRRCGSADGSVERVPLPQGAFVINCTGHIHPVAPVPVLSNDGLVLTTQGVAGFTGPTANALTHMFFLSMLEPWWRKFPCFEGGMSAEGLKKDGIGLDLILTVVFLGTLAMARLPPSVRAVAEIPPDGTNGVLKMMMSGLRFRRNFSKLFAKYRRVAAPRTWGEVCKKGSGRAREATVAAKL